MAFIYIYGAREADLNIVQSLLKRCYKRRYTSALYNVHENLEQYYETISNNPCHPLYTYLPRIKQSVMTLRNSCEQFPKIHTEIKF